MTIRMNNLEQLTLAEMEEFVTNNRHVSWSAIGAESVYEFIERVKEGITAEMLQRQAADRSDTHHALESNLCLGLIVHWNRFPISGSFLDWKTL